MWWIRNSRQYMFWRCWIRLSSMQCFRRIDIIVIYQLMRLDTNSRTCHVFIYPRIEVSDCKRSSWIRIPKGLANTNLSSIWDNVLAVSTTNDVSESTYGTTVNLVLIAIYPYPSRWSITSFAVLELSLLLYNISYGILQCNVLVLYTLLLESFNAKNPDQILPQGSSRRLKKKGYRTFLKLNVLNHSSISWSDDMTFAVLYASVVSLQGLFQQYRCLFHPCFRI